jgi:cytochrome c oxidase cbb3-type subunit III
LNRTNEKGLIQASILRKIPSGIHLDFCKSRVMRPALNQPCNLAFKKMTRNRLLASSLPLTKCAYRAVRPLASLLLLWIAGSFSPAVAGAHSTNGTATRPSVLYHNYCSVCHGDKGDGKSRAQNSLNPPPRDFTTPSAAQLTRASMIDAVTNGRPGTAMTPWKTELNQKEIGSVVDYVRDTFMPASSSKDSSRGRMVYSKNCSVCHGEKGDGKSRAQGSLMPPPRDFTAPGLSTEMTLQRMITSVTYGRPETAMAGFKGQLSKEDISAAVDYIRAGFMASASTEGISGIRNGRRQASPDGSNAPQARTAPAAPSAAATKPVVVNMAAPMPKSLKGDIVKGGAFYMSNCATCHGNTGDGRGPRAYFINPKPRNFLHPAARQEFNRVALYNVISDGKLRTEMPAWRQVLNPQEIANVSEFVFQRFIRPPAGSAKPTKGAAKTAAKAAQ